MSDYFIEKAACLALLIHHIPSSMRKYSKFSRLQEWIDTYWTSIDRMVGTLIALDLLSYKFGEITLTARGLSTAKELYSQISSAYGEGCVLDEVSCGIVSYVLTAVDDIVDIDSAIYSSV